MQGTLKANNGSNSLEVIEKIDLSFTFDDGGICGDAIDG
jgi:hypothetical protein